MPDRLPFLPRAQAGSAPFLRFFLVGLFVFVLYVLRRALLLIYVAALVAIVLDPIVVWIQKLRVRRWHPSRGLAVLLLSLGTIAIAGLLVWIAVPRFMGDFAQLKAIWPERLQAISDWVNTHVPLGIHLTPARATAWIENLVKREVGVWSLFDRVVAVLTTLLMAAYFSADKDRSLEWIFSLFPAGQRSRAERTLRSGSRHAQRWLGGQALLMLAHGGSSFVAFWALGLKLFYILALLAAFYNLIPVLGPVLTLITAGLVAAIRSFGMLLGVVIFYIVYHNIENVFLNPKIMENKVRIPAVAVIVALVVGEELAGIVGILVSVPTAVLLSSIVDEYVASDDASDALPEPQVRAS